MLYQGPFGAIIPFNGFVFGSELFNPIGIFPGTSGMNFLTTESGVPILTEDGQMIDVTI